MTRLTHALVRAFTLAAVRASPLRGTVTVREGGREHVVGRGGERSAAMAIDDERAWPMLWSRRGILDAHLEGYWSSPDLADLFILAADNLPRFDVARRRIAGIRVPWLRFRAALERLAPHEKRRAEASHYELGNDLFALMLDSEMMYSCAYFEDESTSLDEAAVAKLELVCRKLDLGADDRVVEIGSGWGGFAIYAARTRGCHVTTLTVSEQQYALAVERVAAAELEHLVEVRLEDYRDATGSYDKLVSIEMIEAVGHRNLDGFFERCSSLLAPEGSMLLQAITIDDQAYEVAKHSRSFLQTYVFPSSSVPSKRAIADSIGAATDLRMVHFEDLTPHYVTTLRHWRARLEAAGDQLEELRYGVRLRRLLRLYLAYSEAGFASGRTAVGQMVLAKPRCRLDVARARWARG